MSEERKTVRTLKVKTYDFIKDGKVIFTGTTSDCAQFLGITKGTLGWRLYSGSWERKVVGSVTVQQEVNVPTYNSHSVGKKSSYLWFDGNDSWQFTGTIDEAMEYFEASEYKINKWIKNGELKKEFLEKVELKNTNEDVKTWDVISEPKIKRKRNSYVTLKAAVTLGLS